ncbi:hypothetical protein K439DRAFT_1644850 [Ramaria rubella]|nr:hypothetical protein K439DRAFT_1644850 [Ramaria rubella]
MATPTNGLSSLSTYTSVSCSRLQSLYSDFSPQKQSNPAGFQSNVDWWRRTLLQGVLHVNTALFDKLQCDDLGVGKPLGIGSVLVRKVELSSSGIVIPLKSFNTSTRSIYYTGSFPLRIVSYIVGRPLWWALKQLNFVEDGESRESEEKRWKRVQGDYVVVPLLEQAADAVLEYYHSEPQLPLTDSLHSVDTFREEFASKALPGVVLSASDIKVLTKYLERDKGVIVMSKGIIKFIDEEADEGRVRTTKITEQLRRKRKETAMSYLRSHKQLEDLLSKRLQSLETIQSTLLQVESAAGDIAIMKAYETSTMTLRSLLGHPSLQRDKVEATMGAMAEAAADHAEIDEAIRLGGDELQQIIDKKEREEAEEKEMQALVMARQETATGNRRSGTSAASVRRLQ